MGNPALMAGITVDIVDYGQFSGRYYIESTTHSVGSSSYRTSFTAHRVLGDLANDK
jgi:phage protein D